MVLTGADGDLIYAGHRVAKVRNWTLSISREAISDTCLGEFDKTFITGLREATGSCSLFYDPDSQKARDFMNTIFEDKYRPEEIRLVFNRLDGNDSFRCNVMLTNVTQSVDVGAAQACSITFQVSGPIDGRF